MEKAGNRSLKKILDPIVGFFRHFRNKSETAEKSQTDSFRLGLPATASFASKVDFGGNEFRV